MEQIALIYRKKSDTRKSMEGLFKPIDNLPNVNRIELPCDLNSIGNAIKLFIFALKIKERKIHITGDVHYMAIFLFWKQIVITFHDAHHYENLSGLRKMIIGFIWYKAPIFIADKTIFVSPSTKEQFERNFKVKESKIVVIPNTFKKLSSKCMVNNEIFSIIIVGTGSNKNLQGLIEAVKGVDNIKLNIVGKIPNNCSNLLTDYLIQYENFFNISDKELEELYNKSDMLFFVSMQEGFGLPILEAQSCGVPVLTSSTTSMPYVAGDAALIVDPYDVNGITKAILQIRDNDILREDLVRKGYINVTRFDENAFINSYIQVYESI